MRDKNIGEHRLALTEVLDWMVEDGLVSQEAADSLRSERRLHGGKTHPLLVIADQKWRSVKEPRLLSLEVLTEWLAGRCGLDYLHIDPLKIDFTGVAEVMSSAYAARTLSPVEVTQAVIAQIERCETWLQAHPHDPELTLTLGSPCLRQKLWGKAQRYLESALRDADERVGADVGGEDGGEVVAVLSDEGAGAVVADGDGGLRGVAHAAFSSGSSVGRLLAGVAWG
jgi:hypothetical protein